MGQNGYRDLARRSWKNMRKCGDDIRYTLFRGCVDHGIPKVPIPPIFLWWEMSSRAFMASVGRAGLFCTNTKISTRKVLRTKNNAGENFRSQRHVVDGVNFLRQLMKPEFGGFYDRETNWFWGGNSRRRLTPPPLSLSRPGAHYRT